MDSHSHQNWVDFKNKLRSHEFCTNMALKQVLLEQRSVKERLQAGGAIKRKPTMIRAMSENAVFAKMRRRLSNGVDIKGDPAASAIIESSVLAKMRRRLSTGVDIKDDPATPTIVESGVCAKMRRRLSTYGLDTKIDPAAPTTAPVSGHYQHSQKKSTSLHEDTNRHHGRSSMALHTITKAAKTTRTPKNRNAENLMKMVRRGSNPLIDVALSFTAVDDALLFEQTDSDQQPHEGDKNHSVPTRLWQQVTTSFSAGHGESITEEVLHADDDDDDDEEPFPKDILHVYL